MSLRPRWLFQRVAIVGIGLIGGSLGKAIKHHKLAREVVGVSERETTIATALKTQAIDFGFNDLKKGVMHADLVILAAPVNAITRILATIGPHLRRGCIVTDVGSTKESIVTAAHQHLPGHCFFVGSHPLSGSEKKGILFANPHLFENSACIMTPTDKTPKIARDRVKEFWTKIGAQVRFVTPEEHDKILAFVSHLPHLAAYALMESIPADCLSFAAQGLKDTTRIASSSPQMWSDVCMANSKNILHALDEMVKSLSGFRKSIVSRDPKKLVEHFKTAKGKRDSIVPVNEQDEKSDRGDH